MGRCSLLLAVLLAGCTPSVVAEASPEQLEPKQSREAELRPGKIHRFQLALDTDRYLWINVQQLGGDLQLTLRGPDGEKLEAVDDQSGPGGIENLAWITTVGGVYMLEVEASSPPAAGGSYQLTWHTLEPATAVLRKRAPADRSYVRAFGLQSRGGKARWEEAIALYEPTLAVWREIGDAAQEASTLDNLGFCHLRLESFAIARLFFERAVARWPEPDFSPNKANSLHNLASVHNELEQPLAAVRSYQPALEILRASGRPLEAARALHGLGAAYKSAGRLAEAEQALLEALASFEQAAGEHDLVLTLNTLGAVYSHQGRVDEALATLERARERVGEDDPLGIRLSAAVAANLSSIYNWIGDPTLAFEGYRRALELNRRAEDRIGEAEVERQLGLLCRDLGQHEEALAHFERCAELKTGLGKLVGAAEAQVLVADTHRELGRSQEALRLFAQVLPVLEARGKPVDVAMALEKQGLALEAVGRSEAAAVVYRRALSTLGDLEEAGREARLYAAFGAGQLRVGAMTLGETWLAKALERARSCADRATEVAVLVEQARLARRRGQLERAQGLVSDALEVVETVRARMGGEHFRAGYLAQQMGAFELAVEVLTERHRREPGAGFDAQAFELSERMRARVLFERVSAAEVDFRAGVDAELLERERQLRRRLNARESFRQSVGWRLGEQERSALDREIAQRLHELHAVEATIFRQSPRFELLAGHQPLTLAEVGRELLDEETALLEVLLGEVRSFLWVVTRRGHRLVELPARAELETLARRLRELLTLPVPRASQTSEQRRQWAQQVAQSEREYVAEGRRLSALLLEPAAELIADRRLVFVADGALDLLPFAALPMPRSTPDAWEPLIAEREVIQAPSASVLAALRREQREAPDRLLAVFADPVFERSDPRVGSGVTLASMTRSESDAERLGLSRLPHSRSEAEALLGLAAGKGEVLPALDFEASRAKLLAADLGRYRFLHFATHGVIDDQHPELTGIALSNVTRSGEPVEGLLHLHDVYGLRLRAELAVLSACETAVGREVRGEGLLSLTRGFMHAGVPRVVASFWRVNDRSTGELMEHFYAGLLRDGLRPAAALRAAMLAARREAGAQRERHPYYWAGFGLWGDWR